LKDNSHSHRIAHSMDGRFGLDLHQPVLDDVLRQCERSYPMETGGILIGHYSADLTLAQVTDVVPAPGDSTSKRFSFERGIRGLQSVLQRLWAERKYYLGEWHFHPGNSPQPSSTDFEQMRRISTSGGYHCPEPVILVVGGTPPEHVELESYVIVRGSANAVMLHFDHSHHS
jgi:integrative and conjugative element protein (TIGR02256 family)